MPSAPLVSALACGFLLASAVEALAAPRWGHTSQPKGRYGEQVLPSNDVAVSRTGLRRVNVSIPYAVTCDGGDGQGLIAPLLDRVLVTAGVRDGVITPPSGAGEQLRGYYSFRPGRAQSARVTVTLRGRVVGRRAAGALDIHAVLETNQGTSVPPSCTGHLRWRARVSRRPKQPEAPVRDRPRPLFHGVMVIALRGDPNDPAVSLRQLHPPHTEQYALPPASSSFGASALTFPPPGSADSHPATNDRATPIAFVRTTDGVDQVQVFRPMSTIGLAFSPLLEARVTAFAGGARDPAVSPTGTVAFSVGRAPDCSIWIADFEDWQPRALTDHGGRPGCDAAPAWSRDGRLAFRRTLTDESGNVLTVEHMVMDALAEPPHRLDFGPREPDTFSWDPGAQIAFVVRDPVTGVASLDTMLEDGSARRTLLRSPGLAGRPAWSPTQDQILMEMKGADASSDLVRIVVQDGQTYRVTNTPGISEADPVWTSPLSSVGGNLGGPGLHVRSQSAKPHRRRRPQSSG